MKKIFLLLTLLTPLAFMSCSEDVTTPSKGTFLPATKGTWWIMEDYATDSLGNTTGTPSTSTMTVGSTIDLNGKKAVQYLNTIDNVQFDTTLYASEGQIIYTDGTQFNQIGSIFGAFLGGGTSPDLDLNLTWVKIADPNTPSWEVTKVDIPEMDISQLFGGAGGVKANLNGYIKVSGAQGGTEDITIKGKIYSASKFNINVEFIGKVTTTLFNQKVELATINFILGQSYYFVEGIGMVKQLNTGQTFEIKARVPNVPNQNRKTGGNVSTVIDFNIK